VNRWGSSNGSMFKEHGSSSCFRLNFRHMTRRMPSKGSNLMHIETPVKHLKSVTNWSSFGHVSSDLNSSRATLAAWS
jgi:hypothetical protein